jgi:hypothetical protein
MKEVQAEVQKRCDLSCSFERKRALRSFHGILDFDAFVGCVRSIKVCVATQPGESVKSVFGGCGASDRH